MHRFSDERDIIIPYSIAEPYLTRCKKQCRCVEIDPEEAPSTPSNMGNVFLILDDQQQMVKRRSVFSVIGEMDHGKTTLLDTFLHTSYQKQEFGGTTQIIRANDMQIPYKTASGETALHPCTFLDTPGQSCFSFVCSPCDSITDRFEKMAAFSRTWRSTSCLCTRDLPRKLVPSFSR